MVFLWGIRGACPICANFELEKLQKMGKRGDTTLYNPKNVSPRETAKAIDSVARLKFWVDTGDRKKDREERLKRDVNAVCKKNYCANGIYKMIQKAYRDFYPMSTEEMLELPPFKRIVCIKINNLVAAILKDGGDVHKALRLAKPIKDDPVSTDEEAFVDAGQDEEPVAEEPVPEESAPRSRHIIQEDDEEPVAEEPVAKPVPKSRHIIQEDEDYDTAREDNGAGVGLHLRSGTISSPPRTVMTYARFSVGKRTASQASQDSAAAAPTDHDDATPAPKRPPESLEERKMKAEEDRIEIEKRRLRLVESMLEALSRSI